MSNLLIVVDSEQLKCTTSVQVTLRDGIGTSNTGGTSFTARSTPFSGSKLEFDHTSWLRGLTSLVGVISSGENEVSDSLELVGGRVHEQTMSLDESSQFGASLETFTVTSEVELLIDNISIEWEFSAIVSSGSYSIEHRVEDPHFNSSVSSTLVVITKNTFLSKRWKASSDTNEGLPLT
jgi:hypothetical protein